MQVKNEIQNFFKKHIGPVEKIPLEIKMGFLEEIFLYYEEFFYQNSKSEILLSVGYVHKSLTDRCEVFVKSSDDIMFYDDWNYTAVYGGCFYDKDGCDFDISPDVVDVDNWRIEGLSRDGNKNEELNMIAMSTGEIANLFYANRISHSIAFRENMIWLINENENDIDEILNCMKNKDCLSTELIDKYGCVCM